MNEQQFLEAYTRMAEDGACDLPGGNEYDRVLAEWKQLGCPSNIEQFIHASANAGPSGAGPVERN